MNKEMSSRDLDVAKKHDMLVLDFINTVPLLPELSSEQQAGLVKYSRIRRYPKETIVFEGDENQDVYLIMKGSVKAVLLNEDGKEVLLSKLEPGDHFGAVSIFHQLPQSIAIITLEDSEFLVIPPNILMYEIEKDPQIAIHLLFNMSKKLRDSIELIHDLAFLSAKQRVAKALLNYPCENPGEKDDGIMEFKRPPMKDIAACACTSRETASRILREFSEKKLLSMYKKNIFISKELRTNQAQ